MNFLSLVISQHLSKYVAAFLIAGGCAAPAAQTDGDYTLQVIHIFQFGTGISLVSASDGGFYGTTSGFFDGLNSISLPGSVFRATASGSFTTLVSFEGESDRGTDPDGLVEAKDGKLYGFTIFGRNGNGSLFQIARDGGFKELFVFSGTNGARPYGRLLLASDGNLYGTTLSGGLNNQGTVFRIGTTGDGFTNLYNFTGRSDGYQALGGLVETAGGVICGSTSAGGTGGGGTVAGGTIFKLTHAGEFITLFQLNETTGYGFVYFTLAKDGGVYGTAAQGGEQDRGTVFSISSDSNLVVLASFKDGNGTFPRGLVEAGDGSFYGATYGSFFGSTAQAGDLSNGTLFKFTRGAGLTTLAVFNGTNGAQPNRQVALGTDGNVYGVTSAGGQFGKGTLFRLVQTPKLSASTQANGAVSFRWNSFPGAQYRLEYKNRLIKDPWQHLAEITATGNLSTFTNSLPNAAQGYFRLVLLP
ncbi:MAG: hypothetical protein HY043_20405 [Verrucomicrobia bacterium]|nr:hypothetical protein [Verrucomicrobiota bacterium]